MSLAIVNYDCAIISSQCKIKSQILFKKKFKNCTDLNKSESLRLLIMKMNRHL